MEKMKDSSANAKKASKKVTEKKPTQTQLKKELAQTKKEVELIKEKYLRTIADWENYKKRTNREIACVSERAKADLIKDLLPVIDDFERSLTIAKTSGQADETLKGVEMIFRNFLSILKNSGLEPIKSLGEPFNVDTHDAMMLVEKEGVESGRVVDIHETGYLYNGKVLRHAKVIVSR